MTQIIAFVGFKQVGKTTASRYLIDKYGFVKHSFKDALVAEIKEKFPDLLREIVDVCKEVYMRDYTIDDLFTTKPPLIRALMQNYGTEVRRVDEPGYWTTKWMQGALEYIKIVENIVVDDLRFLDEAQTIKDFGTFLNVPYKQTIIRLTRPDLPTGGDHSSETEQLQIEADYTIECEAGDFEKLYAELDRSVGVV